MSEHGQWIAHATHGMNELSHDAVWDVLIHPIGLWTAVRRHVVRAEDDVPEWEEDRVVRVVRFSVVRVMPVVELRRDDDAM